MTTDHRPTMSCCSAIRRKARRTHRRTSSSTVLAGVVLFGCLTLMPAASTTAEEVLFATSSFVSPNLLTIDPVTGTVLTNVPIAGEEALSGLTHDGSVLWSIDGFDDELSDRTFRIEPATANGTPVGDTGFNWNFRTLAFDPKADVLYGLTDSISPSSPANLYTIDRVAGSATPIGTLTGATLDQATAMAIGCDGQAYITDIGGNGLFELDLSTGQATHLGDLNVGLWLRDLAFDQSNRLWGVDTDGNVFTIDIDGAAATFEFNTGLFLRGIAFVPTAVFCDGFESGDTSAWPVSVP